MNNRITSFITVFIAAMYSFAILSCTNDEPNYGIENDITGSVEEDIATQIMKNATVLSNYEDIYAFGISQMVIIGEKAFVNYWVNNKKFDDDVINNTSDICCSEVSLHDMSVNTRKPIIDSKMYANGSATSANSKIGYVTYTATNHGEIASFALMRFKDNNPYYCYAFVNPDEQVYNYITCRLNYTDMSQKEHNVDFTINNYRKMLVDMGYDDNYVVSTKDAYNNINLQYDSKSDSYYAFITTNSEKTNLPFTMMRSYDMATWSPVMSLGNSHGAGEIASVIKEGVVYMSYRTFSHGTRWLVYDLSNKSVISKGTFSECRNVQSKPDTFTFRNDVYMAVNVYPSVYGDDLKYNPYTIRQEINIYKVSNGSPDFIRKVYSQDGINYFSFKESSNGRIYLAFSEDRRHLYRRLFGNVSFVDATVFFSEVQ